MDKLTSKAHVLSHCEFLLLKYPECLFLIVLIHHSREASEVPQKTSRREEALMLP